MGFTPQFTARIDARNGVAGLFLSGELDMATVPILEEHLARFEGNGVSSIMLDLRELTFIDGIGLHAFLRARDRAKKNGHRLILTGAGPTTRRLLEITNTQSLFDDQETVGVLKQFAQRQTRGTGKERTAKVDADVSLA